MDEQNINDFVDETGKKLGLPESDLTEAKQKLVELAKVMAARDDAKQTEYRIRQDRASRKIRHDMAIETLKRQFYCSHRKGAFVLMPVHKAPGETNEQQEDNYNKFLPKLPFFEFDFAVMKHTLPNGQIFIRCMMCNRKWVNTDPDFSEANKMAQFSTNKPSASEQLITMPLPMMPQGAPAIAAVAHKGFWSRFFQALNDHFKSNKGITEENISVEYHDKL